MFPFIAVLISKQSSNCPIPYQQDPLHVGFGTLLTWLYNLATLSVAYRFHHDIFIHAHLVLCSHPSPYYFHLADSFASIQMPIPAFMCHVSIFLTSLFCIWGKTHDIFLFESGLFCLTVLSLFSCKWHHFVPFWGWIILHCVGIPQLLYPFICWRAAGLIPLLAAMSSATIITDAQASLQ